MTEPTPRVTGYTLQQVMNAPPGRWLAAYWDDTTQQHSLQRCVFFALVRLEPEGTFEVAGVLFNTTTGLFEIANATAGYCGLALDVSPGTGAFVCPLGHGAV